MKVQTRKLKSIAVLCGSLALTSAMGQVTTYTWTNSAGGDIAVSTNWNPNAVPNPASGPDLETGLIYGDELLWDGSTANDLSLTANTGQTSFSGQNWGLRIHLTSNQTHAVNIHAPTGVAKTAGTRFNSITIDAGAGAFSLGDDTQFVLDTLWGGTGGVTHYWVNQSTNPVVLYPNVNWRYGGGGAHTFDFGGTGNWIVNNYFRNNNNAGTLVSKSGTGTMTWTGTNVSGAASSILIGSPVIINDGTLVLKSYDLLAAQNFNFNPTALEGVNPVLKYDAPVNSAVLSGTFSGATGTVEVASGMVTLRSGNSTFGGRFNLTGGELVVLGVENPGVSGPLGNNGIISFNGGALGFSVNNTFDYSARFNTAAGQAYKIDTANQNVTFTNAAGLTGTGNTLTKIGGGILTLAGPSSYTGLTTVSAGKLVLAGPKTGAGSITVTDGAALDIVAGGAAITPAVLTVGTTGSASLEFDNVSSTTTAPIAAGAVSTAGTINININSGTFNPGSSYPLFSWTSGSAPAVSLGVLNGYVGNLTTNASTITLNVTATAFKWLGNTSGVWDKTVAGNWQQNGGPVVFADGAPVLFDDTAPGAKTVTIGTLVQPTSVTFNNVSSNYSIASSGGNNIGGSATLTKSGGGTVTLSGGANTYTGLTAINNGLLSVSTLANGGAPSDIGQSGNSAANLVLNGGALQYTGGGVASDRLFTLTTGNGTIDASGSAALTLNNAGPVGFTGNGPRTLTLTGTNSNDNTLTAALLDNGGATAVTKSGTGTWILAGTNNQSGLTTIADGLLQVGTGGSSGSLGSGNVLNSGDLVFNRTGTLTVGGVISGTGSVTNIGSGTVILAANNTYSGGTAISAGTLQVGNGGSSGSLNSGSFIEDNGTLIFNTSGSSSYQGGGLIRGTGNVIVRGGGRIKAIGANSYTGWTLIEGNATFQPTEGNAGGLVSSIVTNNATLKFVRQDTAAFTYNNPIVGTGKVQMGGNNNNAGDITLLGTNTYTGGTFIGSGAIILGDGANPGFGTIVGNVTFVNNFDTPDDNARRLTFNRPEDFTFSGNIVTNFTSAQNNRGIVQQNGPGTLTLTGTNTYASGTVVNAGAIQVGNGGTSGSIGTGPLTLTGNLIWNRSNDATFVGNITGAGSITKGGAGNLTLTSTNYTAYSGPIFITNGTLTIAGFTAPNTTNALFGPIEISGGTLAVGGVSALETQSSLNISSGTIVASLNTSLSPSNTLYSAIGGMAYTGGTLKLINAGPQLVVGQKFTIFTQPVAGGAAMPIVSPGFTVQNNLAVDGSVTVTAVQPPPVISSTVVGNQFNLSWPSAWAGAVHLQVQTNSLSTGLGTNWVTIPGTDIGSTYSATINLSNGAVFYRLIIP